MLKIIKERKKRKKKFPLLMKRKLPSNFGQIYDHKEMKRRTRQRLSYHSTAPEMTNNVWKYIIKQQQNQNETLQISLNKT